MALSPHFAGAGQDPGSSHGAVWGPGGGNGRQSAQWPANPGAPEHGTPAPAPQGQLSGRRHGQCPPTGLGLGKAEGRGSADGSGAARQQGVLLGAAGLAPSLVSPLLSTCTHPCTHTCTLASTQSLLLTAVSPVPGLSWGLRLFIEPVAIQPEPFCGPAHAPHQATETHLCSEPPPRPVTPPPRCPQQAKLTFYRCSVLLRWRLRHTLFCALAWESGLSAHHFLWTCLVSGRSGGQDGGGDWLGLPRAGGWSWSVQGQRSGPGE